MVVISNNKIVSLMVLAGLGLAVAANATDTGKEKRWAEQIADALVVGDAEWLDADGHQFLAIYTEQTSARAKGGAILMHGTGVHPDWSDVIAPLRSELPDYGWSTLSIQMPVLPNEAKHEDYAPLYQEVPPRIEAAMRFLEDNGVTNIVLIGHSQGAAMGASYLASAAPGRIKVKAFVAIGLSAPKGADPRMDTRAFLAKIQTPTLDLYGSQDLDTVRMSSEARKNAARKAGNNKYRQDEVPGANHFFNGLNADLVRRVRSYLERYAAAQ